MRRFPVVVLVVVATAVGARLLQRSGDVPQEVARPPETDAPSRGRGESVRSPPYGAMSPWNRPIPEDVRIHPDSERYVTRVAAAGRFGSDPQQYTYPVYVVDDTTPLQSVQVHGRLSIVDAPNALRTMVAANVEVPVPDNAMSSSGSDGSIVLWNRDTGEEWGFWQFSRAAGSLAARNGYRYNTSWSGVPPRGFVSRGAGLPYLAGLVRREEMEDGSVDHALAFAYNSAAPVFVHPATKSDGRGDVRMDLPEGARLQLDPRITEAEFRAWGLDTEGMILARAMQRYGMIVVDNSGHPKVMVEDVRTAKWGVPGAPVITAETVAAIPLDRFRVIDWARWTGGSA